MKQSVNHRVRRILAAVVLTVVLTGMAAASLYSLYRYAQYGMQKDENSVQTEPASSEPGTEAEAAELLSRKDTDMTIRVRILGDDYQKQTHPRVTVTSQDGMVVWKGAEQTIVPAGEAWSVSEVTECVTLEPEHGGMFTLPELVRSQKAPSYSGILKLYPENGEIALINEVDLEEYLYSVVSSEMPSDYPQQALCAQAVCARTYALGCMERQTEKSTIADLDDSVSYQVYNNYGKNDASVAAVDRTRGVVLNSGEALYYSTSCLTGHRTDLDTEQAFRRFLAEEPEEDAEYGSPWVRWSVSLSEEEILENLREDQIGILKELDEIRIGRRGGDGQILEMVFGCDGTEISVEGEYRIRKLCSPVREQVILRNGQPVEGLRLLPSAYFYIDKNENHGWDIFGGGYGHGKGMSQYGAAAMAADGADYQSILAYYYGESSSDSETAGNETEKENMI